MILIRSLLFNIFFYGFTILACLVLVPLVLFPRKVILGTALFYLKVVELIEKYILGLTFEVRGKEYLPQDGSYIIAAKHQSAYETLKLHNLFGDPSVVLKESLTRIPIFGTFLKKLDIIAINRSNKEEALNSIVEGTKRMATQNRPIVIFPQGTRVAPHTPVDKKPYKGGILKMYKNTDLKVIPLALNAGLFWGRNSFIKRPGRVIFEFLPPIEAGLPEKKVMEALENRIEEKTHQLMREAQEEFPHTRQVKLIGAPS
ncbi:MAG: lysophospholipid acyltransferase family protein [Pseudomonadota bacterium]